MEDNLSDKIREQQFQQELQALSESYRSRLAKERKLDQSVEEVIAALKQIREKIAANNHRQ